MMIGLSSIFLGPACSSNRVPFGRGRKLEEAGAGCFDFSGGLSSRRRDDELSDRPELPERLSCRRESDDGFRLLPPPLPRLSDSFFFSLFFSSSNSSLCGRRTASIHSSTNLSSPVAGTLGRASGSTFGRGGSTFILTG